MDVEKFKVSVDTKVQEFDRNLLNLSNLSGHGLKDRIFQLVSYLSTFNEYIDRVNLQISIKEGLLKEVKSVARKQLMSNVEKKLSDAAIKDLVETENVELEPGTFISMVRIQEELSYLHYGLDRFESMYSDIDKAISTGQSGLAYDRTELSQTHNS